MVDQNLNNGKKMQSGKVVWKQWRTLVWWQRYWKQWGGENQTSTTGLGCGLDNHYSCRFFGRPALSVKYYSPRLRRKISKITTIYQYLEEKYKTTTWDIQWKIQHFKTLLSSFFTFEILITIDVISLLHYWKDTHHIFREPPWLWK